ncbi:MAG: AAA family ATPase, partial [Bacteroidales bacterium]
MRIVAVRGLNIASLGGEFSVDFTLPALNNAGLFAITGPTGSGKSTLLDVICLALYNATPRLRYALSRKQIDLEELTPQDPRNLLRKGCGEGYAEVDFEGIDHQIYRTRFYCYRARKNPKGRLQSVERMLFNLSKGGEQIALGKNEMQDKIDSLIGLNFEQFTRAVLLAQNDFATFLKADDAEKAELLEKLTGSEIYAQISALIYRKTSDSIQVYKELESQVAAYPVLNDDELIVVQEKEKQTQQTIHRLNMQIECLREGLRWLDTYIQLQADFDRNKDEERLILQQLSDNRERQLQLLRIDATQPVKPLWFKMTTLNANSLLLTKEVNDKQTALQILTDQSVANALQLKQAEEERTRLRRFSEALQPQLKEARRLDNQLLFVRNERTRLETLLKEQEQRISFMHQNQLTLQKEIEALHISQSRINDWINQHKVFEKMIPAVPALLIQLEAYAKGKAEIDPVRLESKRLTTDSIQLEESSIARKQQLDVLFTQIETLRKELVLKQTLLEQANPHILRTQSEELAAQLRALTEWAAYTSQERSYAESLRINTTALNDTSLECQKAASELHTQTLQLSELETRLEEAEQAHRLTLSMANHSVESLRDNLEKDKPCPVCGALDHPFSDRNTITRIVGELEKHYQDILAQTQSARQLLTTQTAALAALEQSLTKLTTEKEFLARQTEENKQHVSQLTDAFPFLADLATGSYKLIYSQILAKSEEIKKQLDEAAQIELSVNLLRKEQITKEDHLREQQKLYDQLRNQTEENKKNASEMTMRYQTLKES